MKAPKKSIIRTSLTLVGVPLRHLSAWLKHAPIEDSLDRRNAPFLQAVLLLIIVWAPISTAIALVQSLQGSRLDYEQILLRLTDDLSALACVCLSLWLVRRGNLRGAAQLFVGFLTFSMAVMYTITGIEKIPADLLPLLLLAIGGQMLGRRALWWVFAAMLGSLIASYVSQVVFIRPGKFVYAHGLIKVATVGVIYFMVAVVIDQTVVALRQAIIESHEREQSLEKLSRKLQVEILNHRLAQEKLMHVHKIEAVNRIAAGVAHDFGNVLSIISGYADHYESISDRGMGAMIDAMKDIGAAAKMASHLNRQLLDFSRKSVANNEVFDVSAAARAAMKLVQRTFPGHIHVSFEEAPTPLPIFFDRSHFDLIVLNMAANARDAMPEGGDFQMSCGEQDGNAVVCFRDTGFGMDSQTIEKLFEPFFTTKATGKGTGLGLTLVSELVHGAQGEIEVRSTPGEGSEFRIRLPLATADNARAQAFLSA